MLNKNGGAVSSSTTSRVKGEGVTLSRRRQLKKGSEGSKGGSKKSQIDTEDEFFDAVDNLYLKCDSVYEKLFKETEKIDEEYNKIYDEAIDADLDVGYSEDPLCSPYIIP